MLGFSSLTRGLVVTAPGLCGPGDGAGSPAGSSSGAGPGSEGGVGACPRSGGLREVTPAPALTQLWQDSGSGQALPVALECSGALEVHLGQGEESGSHTRLNFLCLSRDRK